MFSNMFSKMGWPPGAGEREGGEIDGEVSESNEQIPDDVPQATPATTAAGGTWPSRGGSPRRRVGSDTQGRHQRHFSETEFMDSGLAGSFMAELPFAGLHSSELDALEYDQRFLEEFILSKLQDVHRRLHAVRDRKRALRSAMTGPRPAEAEGSPKRRSSECLFVASHRLPLIVEVGDDGRVKTSVRTASLGLVSAFRDLLEIVPIVWVGAPGQTSVDLSLISEEERASLKQHFSSQAKQALSLLKYVPVFPNIEDAMSHAEFCNSVLWSLFHYMMLSFEGERTFHVDMFDSYRKVNEFYANALIDEWKSSGIDESDAMFWIHDLHLMLVPKILRDRLPNSRIGFFLHTPFPAGEVFRTLPPRKELLEGILGSDLVGFHTYDYARHFLSCCERLLGLDTRPNGVDDKGVFVKVGIYPFGIDADVFRATMKKTSVTQRVDDLRAGLSDKKIILGVDRLDYIKGIPHKLLAIEHFLEAHPEWIGRLVLLQVTAPSESLSEEYLSFRSGILELVGRINGRFSTLEDMPILYREKILTFDELCALYAVADVAVMTSLRDGMNLASYEYVTCQLGYNGALVLSEFTGAARNLPGAILCNPWNIEEVSDAIYRSLTMPDFERELKFQKLYRYVTKHTSATWGLHFIEDMTKHAEQRKKSFEELEKLPLETVTTSYATATGKRLLLLDYDGTIRKYESQPELAEPSERLLELLRRLTNCEQNIVFIVTGRQKSTVMEWMDGNGLGFAVEHGFSIRWPDHLRARFGGPAYPSEPGDETTAGDWDDLLSPRQVVMMRAALEHAGSTLRRIEDYTPNTFVTAKESAYSWHFRDADPDFAGSHALDARSVLEEMVSGSLMEVVMGQKILYVRPRGVDKGESTKEILRRLNKEGASPMWILSIGDDRTDEDMFSALNQLPVADGATVTTCTVGRKRTAAKFYVEDVDEVLELLEKLGDV